MGAYLWREADLLFFLCFLQSGSGLLHCTIPWTRDWAIDFWVYQPGELSFRSTYRFPRGWRYDNYVLRLSPS